jgi:hypothetical protein
MMEHTRPRLFFYCYSHQQPRGGQLDTYRQVETLCKHGLRAYVVHDAAEYRLQWFDNWAPLMSMQEVLRTIDPARDILVLPEDRIQSINTYPGRKVIFNKCVPGGFATIPELGSRNPFEDSSIIAVMTISEPNTRLLQFALHSTPIYTVLPFIDWPLFGSSRPTLLGRRTISVVPKGRPSVFTTYRILQARAKAGLSSTANFSWITLGNLNASEYAEVLRRSACLLFFSEDEGLGRAPLEALVAGCVPLVYDGGPLAFSLARDFCYRHGDYCSIVHGIEEVCCAALYGSTKWDSLLSAADATIRQEYSLERYTEVVVNAWKHILAL